MSDRKKTCFIICPIGDDSSDIRKNADDLLELIIEPALETFGFNIVRADKITTPSLITNDIIKLVQDSELCIVDLTSHNPNVYYECGRRHENGKPSIQLISKGDKIPFDLAGIRTVSYDLSSARAIRETILKVRDYVRPFESAGYVVSTSGSSLTTIAESIDRIERQLTRLSSEKMSLGSSGGEDDFALLMKGPKTAIIDCLKAGNVDAAESLFNRYKSRLQISQLVEVSAYLSSFGSKAGRDALMELVPNLPKEIDETTVKLCIGTIAQYYVVNDLESDGVKEAVSLFDSISVIYKNQPEILAIIAWQKSRLYYGSSKAADGYKWAERAAHLDENEYRERFEAIEPPLPE